MSPQIGCEVEAAMTTVAQARVGMTMPEIIFPSLNGEEVSLSHFRGKKLVLFMWASW